MRRDALPRVRDQDAPDTLVCFTFAMSISTRSRTLGTLLVALFMAAFARAGDLGVKAAYKKDTPVPLATFRLTYMGQRRVASEKYPRGFLIYDFRVNSAQGTQTISWSSGTGDIAPVLFRVGGEGFTLELQHSDKLGQLKDSELVVSRAP